MELGPLWPDEQNHMGPLWVTRPQLSHATRTINWTEMGSIMLSERTAEPARSTRLQTFLTVFNFYPLSG